MIEVEVKAWIEDLTEIEKRILQDNARYVKTLHQKDIYFKHPTRNFAKTDEAIRVRCEDDRSLITYKGPKLDKKSKSREEYEVEIKNPEKMQEILVKLDFTPVPSVEKVRRIYEVDEMIVALDEVKDVGKFIEVEMEAETPDEYKVKRNKILARLKKWSISKNQLERSSYLELFFLKKGLERE